MLNSGPHESFDAAQMSAADHAALRARLLALFPVPGALPDHPCPGLSRVNFARDNHPGQKTQGFPRLFERCPGALREMK
jgi:hypothetical protein